MYCHQHLAAVYVLPQHVWTYAFHKKVGMHISACNPRLGLEPRLPRNFPIMTTAILLQGGQPISLMLL